MGQGPKVDKPFSSGAVKTSKGHPDANWKGAGANVKSNKAGPDRKSKGK